MSVSSMLIVCVCAYWPTAKDSLNLLASERPLTDRFNHGSTWRSPIRKQDLKPGARAHTHTTCRAEMDGQVKHKCTLHGSR